MNPFITIWSRPKETLQYILDEKTVGYAVMLTLLGSLVSSIMAFSDTGFFGDFPLVAILAISFGAAIVLGLMGWGFMTLLYTLVGKMLGGSGTMPQVSKIVASSALPGIWMAPINVLILLIYGKDLYEAPQIYEFTVLPIAVYLIYNLITLGIGVYAIVIQSMGLGLAHGFSSLRGFGAVAIVTGFLIVITLIISFAIISIFIFK
ncbi:YIP1 family protein [Chungangia koreensis]|uniref:YIP1 family protein n=1 Tax=Chungangia koreensis TaxID=752657 RepID=A0ABV8X107_9LACT